MPRKVGAVPDFAPVVLNFVARFIMRPYIYEALTSFHSHLRPKLHFVVKFDKRYDGSVILSTFKRHTFSG